jgi:uncharacterized protein (TIGR02996 family)
MIVENPFCQSGVAGWWLMHEEQAFLQAMQENPEDTSLRLVFADWLEERDDPRGELIRLLHTLTQSVAVPDRCKLEARLRSLVSAGVQPVGPFFTNSLGMTFAWIPAGTFLMGRSESEGRSTLEIPQHKVTLTRGFYLAIYPVTQACWEAVMGNNPSRTKSKKRPVEGVSWHDCQKFLRKLSKRDGPAYRLPTEAEWEYACRAGTTSPFYFGETISTDQANFEDDFNEWDAPTRSKKTTLVGSFPPNAWGLHDMHGNIWEWCNDRYGKYRNEEAVDPQGPAEGEDRVVRGGMYGIDATWLTSASRLSQSPDSGLWGFRSAMRPGPT